MCFSFYKCYVALLYSPLQEENHKKTRTETFCSGCRKLSISENPEPFAIITQWRGPFQVWSLGWAGPLEPFHSQGWPTSNFFSSLTKDITWHSMKKLAFHRWKMIMLPIFTTSLHMHFSLKGWKNVLFELGSGRVINSWEVWTESGHDSESDLTRTVALQATNFCICIRYRNLSNPWKCFHPVDNHFSLSINQLYLPHIYEIIGVFLEAWQSLE